MPRNFGPKAPVTRSVCRPCRFVGQAKNYRRSVLDPPPSCPNCGGATVWSKVYNVPSEAQAA